MPNVLALLAHSGDGNTPTIGACEYYRIFIPFTELTKRDKRWKAGWMTVQKLAEIYHLSGPNGLGRFLENIDFLVLPRWWYRNGLEEEAEKFISLFRMLGKKVIYETDDDYTNQSRVVHDGGNSSVHMASMCDANTVSTPYLAKLMHETSGRPTYVCPNSLDFNQWNRGDKLYEFPGLTIGLSGTKTHYNDWIVLKDVMPGILRDYPNVHLLLGHFHPDYFDESALPYPDRVHRVPGVSYEVYPSLVNSSDIILAPLDPDDGFNLSKSPVKALEGMAVGAAVLASDHLVYRGTVDGANGMLVSHTPEAWDAAIRAVLSDEDRRRRLQKKGYRWVRNNRNIEKTWIHWRDAFKTILRSKIS